MLALIFDHRHRGNLHIKAWLLAGPLPMLEEAVGTGRQACIGTYHEPYQEACQGSGRVEGVQESLIAGQHQLAGLAKEGVGVCSSKPGEEPVQQRTKPKPHCHSRKSSLRSALGVLETTSSLGFVAGCHIRAAPGGSTGVAPAATLNSGRGSNVVRSLVFSSSHQPRCRRT